jgi:hypothetical protein
MADVLMIAGKPETIFNARDFEYLVEKHMGYEAAKYFREYAEKLMKKSDRPRPVRTQTLLPMKLTLKAITEPFRTFRRKPQLSRVFFKKNG